MVTWVDGSKLAMCANHAAWARKVMIETLGGYIHFDPDDLKPDSRCEQIVKTADVIAALRREIDADDARSGGHATELSSGAVQGPTGADTQPD